MTEAVAELRRLLDERMREPAGEWTESPLVRALAARPAVAAVVLYGAHRYGPASSEPDFFVLVDSLRRYHGRRAAALADALLPPGVRHLAIGGARAKASVVSLDRLAVETSPAARDLYHLGRFSKPIAIAFGRDPAAREAVLDAQASSLLVLAPHARALLPPVFTIDAFVNTLFALSYLGEVRVVEPDKVRAIFETDRERHRAIGRLLLAARPKAAPPGETARLIARSRRRALLRWPKLVATFDGWLDYALAKVERHAGRPVALSPRARRHPLLFGWPALAALRREGLLR